MTRLSQGRPLNTFSILSAIVDRSSWLTVQFGMPPGSRCATRTSPFDAAGCPGHQPPLSGTGTDALAPTLVYYKPTLSFSLFISPYPSWVFTTTRSRMPPKTHSLARQPPQASLYSPIDAAFSVAEAALSNATPRVVHESPGAVHQAARAAATAAAAVHIGRPRDLPATSVCRVHHGTAGGGARGSCAMQKRRTCILKINDKLGILTAREGGMSFTSIRATVAPAASIMNLRKVWENRADYKAVASSRVRLDRRTAHGSHFDAVDRRPYKLVLVVLLVWAQAHPLQYLPLIKEGQANRGGAGLRRLWCIAGVCASLRKTP